MAFKVFRLDFLRRKEGASPLLGGLDCYMKTIHLTFPGTQASGRRKDGSRVHGNKLFRGDLPHKGSSLPAISLKLNTEGSPGVYRRGR